MPTEIKMPPLGEGIESAEVLELKVPDGASVRAGQALIAVQADKASAELEAPENGRVVKFLVKAGDMLQVGQAYCLFEAVGTAQATNAPRSGTTQPVAAPPKPRPPPPPERATAAPPRAERAHEDGVKVAAAAKPQTAVVPAGPATRQLARRLGIDLGAVHGSGRGGRITQEDIEAHVRQLASGATPNATNVQAPPLPDFSRWGPVEHQPLDPIRRRTAQRVHLAWSLIPHVTQHDLADITDLDAFRKQQENRGPKLTVTAFALKAAAIALRQFARFNASLDLAAGQLILKRYYHLGVAVDTDHGLLVPVIRDVDKKTVLELATELSEVAERARQRTLQADEMRGGTFTITNLGGIGGTGFSPIINYPEVAILGLSRARLEPVVRDGEIVSRLLLPLSLSYDHRVIDGADAARFTRRLAEMLENGWNMVLHG